MVKRMQKKVIWMMSCMFILGLSLLGSKNVEAATAEVVLPTERAVYQRNEMNQADMRVQVNYTGDKQVVASLMKEDAKISNDVVLAAKEGDATTYEGSISSVPAGGWYTLVVKTVDPQTNEQESSVTVEKIGVGEVFITAGQSNSCNFGWEKTKAESDQVSAFNPTTDQWQHCEDAQPCISGFAEGNGSGSPWPTAGDELYTALEVPIGFVTTGFGGSTIQQLIDEHYEPIKDAIDSLKPYGYRAILLYQGEGDSGEGTKKAAYAESLTNLIAKTREDAGYDVTWMVANAAYTWYTTAAAEKEILDAQIEVCNETDIFLGPYTDDLIDEYRGSDKLHFSGLGLKEHGHRWAEAIVDKLIPDYSLLPTPTPIPTATPMPTATPTSTPNPVTPEPTLIPTVIPTVTPTVTPTSVPTPTVKSDTSVQAEKETNVGIVFKKGIFQYKITKDGKGKKKVRVTAIVKNKKTSVVILSKVKYKGVTYQVEAIDKKAFKKMKKLKKVKVPASLYKSCKKLLKAKKVVIKKY
ncbi:MAG: sialate O-acetylesterase [Eubacterium sp.]